jgi:undecaprenyl-diphosphatase
VTLLQAIILGLVQGLTEFIPISSTAHLRIVPALLGWPDPGAAASAVIQIGTLLAVLIYFWNDIVRMTAAFFRGIIRRQPFAEPDSRLAWYIAAGSVPIVVLGLAFQDFIETGARSLWLISTTLIVLAILLKIAEMVAAKRERLRGENEVTFADAMTIGFGQSLALIPGVSRSGSTIMSGLFRGLSHAAAARFSFLLSIPAIAGSGVYELIGEWEHFRDLGWTPVIVSVVVAFISGWASIWFLLRYLRTHTTDVFIWYRIALGLLMIALLSTGRLTA